METHLQQLNADRNRISKEIGQRKKPGRGKTGEMEDKVRSFSQEAANLDRMAEESGERQRDLLLRPAESPAPQRPGRFRTRARIRSSAIGERKPDVKALDHIEIATRLGLLDLDRARQDKRQRLRLLHRPGAAALERALINFMLDLHTARPRIHGKSARRSWCGARQWSAPASSRKFEEDMYFPGGRRASSSRPTAEVPVTNLLPRGNPSRRQPAEKDGRLHSLFSAGKLAPPAGKPRGLIRVHQFDKVELVRISTPENSYDDLENLTADAEQVLRFAGGCITASIEPLHRRTSVSAPRRPTTSKYGRPARTPYLEVFELLELRGLPSPPP